MTSCRLFQFDLGACIAGSVFGWVPDWLWPLMAYWPWLVGAAVVGLVWKFSGWPGLIALAGAVGFFAGRRSVASDPVEHVSGPDADPPVRHRQRAPVPAPKRRKTIFDAFRK